MMTASATQQAAPLRLHFYTVAIRPPAQIGTANAKKEKDRKPMDLSLLAHAAMQRIREQAANDGFAESVRVRADHHGLTSRGIFFMEAPARFAESVRMLDGVQSVETPRCKRKTHPRRVSRL